MMGMGGRVKTNYEALLRERRGGVVWVVLLARPQLLAVGAVVRPPHTIL